MPRQGRVTQRFERRKERVPRSVQRGMKEKQDPAQGSDQPPEGAVVDPAAIAQFLERMASLPLTREFLSRDLIQHTQTRTLDVSVGSGLKLTLVTTEGITTQRAGELVQALTPCVAQARSARTLPAFEALHGQIPQVSDVRITAVILAPESSAASQQKLLFNLAETSLAQAFLFGVQARLIWQALYYDAPAFSDVSTLTSLLASDEPLTSLRLALLPPERFEVLPGVFAPIRAEVRQAILGKRNLRTEVDTLLTIATSTDNAVVQRRALDLIFGTDTSGERGLPPLVEMEHSRQVSNALLFEIIQADQSDGNWERMSRLLAVVNRDYGIPGVYTLFTKAYEAVTDIKGTKLRRHTKTASNDALLGFIHDFLYPQAQDLGYGFWQQIAQAFSCGFMDELIAFSNIVALGMQLNGQAILTLSKAAGQTFQRPAELADAMDTQHLVVTQVFHMGVIDYGPLTGILAERGQLYEAEKARREQEHAGDTSINPALGVENIFSIESEDTVLGELVAASPLQGNRILRPRDPLSVLQQVFEPESEPDFLAGVHPVIPKKPVQDVINHDLFLTPFLPYHDVFTRLAALGIVGIAIENDTTASLLINGQRVGEANALIAVQFTYNTEAGAFCPINLGYLDIIDHYPGQRLDDLLNVVTEAIRRAQRLAINPELEGVKTRNSGMPGRLVDVCNVEARGGAGDLFPDLHLSPIRILPGRQPGSTLVATMNCDCAFVQK